MPDTPDEKLESLDDRIEQAQKSSTIAPPPADTLDSVHNNPGMRAGSEFLAHVIAGGFLGWACDHFLPTSPWGLVVFILTGFCTGIWRANVAINRK